MCIYAYMHISAYIYILIGVDLGTVPDTPNIRKMFTNIAHRFVHQSGLDESSGRNSTTFRHRIAFRVHFVVSKISRTLTITNTYPHPSRKTEYNQLEIKWYVVSQEKQKRLRQAWNAVSGAWGPIPIRMLLIWIDIDYYALLVLSRVLYSNYIGLATSIVTSWVQ